MTSKKFIALLLSIQIVSTPLAAYGHGGGLNSDGCHNQTSNNTYHCHNGSSSDSSSSSSMSDGDTGNLLLLLLGIILIVKAVDANNFQEEPQANESQFQPSISINEDENVVVNLNYKF